MMTAIAPPPVGEEAEPAVQRDNARALERLRGAQATRARAGRSGHRPLRALLGLGALTLLARAVGRALSRKRKMRAW